MIGKVRQKQKIAELKDSTVTMYEHNYYFVSLIFSKSFISSWHHKTKRDVCVCVWGRGVLPHVPCAFHFMETLRLVEITSLLHVIVMLEEKISKND